VFDSGERRVRNKHTGGSILGAEALPSLLPEVTAAPVTDYRSDSKWEVYPINLEGVAKASRK